MNNLREHIACSMYSLDWHSEKILPWPDWDNAGSIVKSIYRARADRAIAITFAFYGDCFPIGEDDPETCPAQNKPADCCGWHSACALALTIDSNGKLDPDTVAHI